MAIVNASPIDGGTARTPRKNSPIATRTSRIGAIEIESIATPELDDPVFIEGVPGIGLVGKLAVDHLVEELDSKPVRRVYSEYFPPAISVDEDGTATHSS